MRTVKASARTTATLVIVSLFLPGHCKTQPKGTTQDKPVFRVPFVLKLRIDRQHYYEQKFGKVPYVANGDVYLFAGDSFGINAAVTEGRISQITYQPNATRADVEFAFTQEKAANSWMMMLVIQNKLKRKVYLDALMTIPGKNTILKTDILPIPPGLTDYESWPHPIVQLVLKNLRFTAKEPEVKGQ